MNFKSIYTALIGVVFSASCLVNVANAGIIYDFDIRVNFDGGLTSSQQDIFSDAEDFWEFFIVGYRDELVGPGLDISASGQNIDGVGGILGQAGPTLGIFLPSYVYATDGVMEFDSADLLSMETAGNLFDVIVHEMAHVIGFGILSKLSVPIPILNTTDDNFEVTLSKVHAKSVVVKKYLSSQIT